MTLSFYFITLLITIILELLIALIFSFRKRELLFIVAANLITHPILTIIAGIIRTINSNFGQNFLLDISVLFAPELIVVFVEFFLLFLQFKNKYSWRHILLLSFIMNIISFVVGEIILRIFLL